MLEMPYDSFEFGGRNSLTDWGIRVVKYDTLLPPKRPRKRAIPLRHGQYDYGATHYEERTVRIDCTLERKMSRAELRDIAYALHQKGRLALWDEPDRFYIGELYDPAEIEDYFDEAMREFTLTFVCEPFAYSKEFTLTGTGLAFRNDGTAESPCAVELTAPAETITVTMGEQTCTLDGLTVGQHIRINSADFTCTVDGANALHLLSGNWLTIPPKANVALAADPACALTLTWRKRYL